MLFLHIWTVVRVLVSLRPSALFLSHRYLMLVQRHLFLLLLLRTLASFLLVQHGYGVMFDLIHKFILPLFLFLFEFDLLALLGGVTMGVQVIDDIQRFVFVGLLAQFSRVQCVVGIPLLGRKVDLMDGLGFV